MISDVQSQNSSANTGGNRRILCVFPQYESSFGTFEYAYDVTAGVRAFMPPQGLLVIAAALPEGWEVRLIDENIQPASSKDFDWADAVFVSGMHVQKERMKDICRRAHDAGKPTVLGGPSVSSTPHEYPEFDYLHVGELGDATTELFDRLSNDCTRPDEQMVFATVVRRELADFPPPAYELLPLERYFIGSIQFSSGCPYQCEFCDIPALYGRVPRLKTPQQIVAELDKMVACGLSDAVYFVDDNFIANRRAVRELIPHLTAWQKKNGYPLAFACEATLNIAKHEDLLAAMRDAYFTTVFCGIETPEPAALKAMAKSHNMDLPILDAVKTLNKYGLEVVSGIIMGLDTDTSSSGENIVAFVEESKIPMLTVNLIQALPRTPLWDRLIKEGRLLTDSNLESNVAFKMPYDEVLGMWRESLRQIYDPQALFDRYAHQADATHPNRMRHPNPMARFTPRNIKRGLVIMSRVIWKIGILGEYRRVFWKFALDRARKGQIEQIIAVGILSRHLITFAEQARLGRLAASHYSARTSA